MHNKLLKPSALSFVQRNALLQYYVIIFIILWQFYYCGHFRFLPEFWKKLI